MEIVYQYSDGDLMGDAEGREYDLATSCVQFEVAVSAALGREYPDVEVWIICHRNSTGWDGAARIDGRYGTAEADFIEDIVQDVWQTFEWAVLA